MDKERFLASGLLEQYVLGLTSPEESEEVERYAETYPEIKAEIESLQQAMEQYAMQYAVPPPKELKSKILTEIEHQDTNDQPQVPQQITPSVKKGTNWPFIFAFASIVVMSVLSGNLYLQKKALESQLRATSAAYASFQKECLEDKAKQTELGQLYAFLNKPGTKTVQLNGSELAPDAIAVAYWNETEKKGYVNLLSLPTPPPGKQYQIWADIDHEMVSMGVLKSENGRIQPIAFGENATSLNITLEPEGGSEKPNVALLYVNGPV